MKKATRNFLIIFGAFMVLGVSVALIEYNSGKRLREAEAWEKKMKEDGKKVDELIRASKSIREHAKAFDDKKKSEKTK